MRCKNCRARRAVPVRMDMPRIDARHRRSIRLQGYDYSQAGAYFVTICTQGSACLFGGIENDAMTLNEYGCVVRDEWLRTAGIRAEIQTGEFVVMPNHFHGIVIIDSGMGGHDGGGGGGGPGDRRQR